MKKLLIILLVLSCRTANAQIKQFFEMNQQTSTTPFDSLLVNVGSAQSQSGWVNMLADPSTGIRTGTGGNSGTISVSSVATANWFPYGGCSCSASAGNGNTGYTAPPAQVAKEGWFSYNNGAPDVDLYNSTKAKFHTSGWSTSSTARYTLVFYASFTFAFTGTEDVRVKGISTSSLQTINPASNTSGVLTFTSIQPDASGNIDLFLNAETGQAVAFISGFKITQTAL